MTPRESTRPGRVQFRNDVYRRDERKTVVVDRGGRKGQLSRSAPAAGAELRARVGGTPLFPQCALWSARKGAVIDASLSATSDCKRHKLRSRIPRSSRCAMVL
jgi:hypothetical protein